MIKIFDFYHLVHTASNNILQYSTVAGVAVPDILVHCFMTVLYHDNVIEYELLLCSVQRNNWIIAL